LKTFPLQVRRHSSIRQRGISPFICIRSLCQFYRDRAASHSYLRSVVKHHQRSTFQGGTSWSLHWANCRSVLRTF